MARRSPIVRLAEAADIAFLRTVLRTPHDNPWEPRSKLAELRGIRDETHARIGALGEGALFPRGDARNVVVEQTKRSLGAELSTLSFPSEIPSLFPSSRGAYANLARNRRAHARLYRRGRGRPAVVLVHGYLMGDLDFDARFAWPVSRLLARGLDVALVVLPGHGPRNELGRLRPAWPAREPRFVIDGFRQAMFDLTTVTAYLRAEGASAVGVIGMSLGGYTTALLSTVDDALDFVIPLIPITSFADHMKENDHYPGTLEERAELHAAFDAVHAPIDPLQRAVLVAPAGRFVVAGLADRVTPPSQAERIAAHFGVRVTYFEGGHLVPIGRDRALLSAVDRLFDTGVLREGR